MAEIKNIFDISGRAMAAQLVRLNTVASNLANAGTIASTKEEAFRALKPVFQTTYADQLKGDLLIVHGTTDNNVHPQNSIMLIDALVRADKIFDVMFYPDNRHGIRGAHGAHYNKIRMRYLTVKH